MSTSNISADKRAQYSYSYEWRNGVSSWKIYALDPECHVVAEFPDDPTWGGDGPPPAVRAEYERAIEYNPTQKNPDLFNVVEFAAAGNDECAFDQPCRYGNRVDGHAVYCHNQYWLYAPRKCHRTWFTGGEVKDEDCEGYSPNPHYKKKDVMDESVVME